MGWEFDWKLCMGYQLFSLSASVFMVSMLTLQKRAHLGSFTANGYVLRGVCRIICHAKVKDKYLTFA